MDIHDLLQSVTLKDVRTILREGALKLDPASGQGLAALGDMLPSGDVAIDLNPVSWDSHIETWFRLTLETEQVKLGAAVAVLYDRDSDEAIPESVKIEFLEKVAVMAAFPYLRAEIQDLASGLRLGNVTLGMLRQGEFTVQPPETPDGTG